MNLGAFVGGFVFYGYKKQCEYPVEIEDGDQEAFEREIEDYR